MDIHIEASYNPRTRTKIRSVGKWLWNAVSDCAISFVGGDPQTTAGTVASIAGGILVVGDVGSICKNLYRMTGFSDTEPNYVEMSLGGLGVATTALAVTGVGAAIPVAIAPLKTLAIRFGNQGVQMLTVFIDMIRHSMSSGVISFQMRHLSLVETMVTDVPVSQAYRAFAHTPDVVNAAAKAADDVIGVGAGFHQAIVRTVSTHGNDIAKALADTVGGLGDAALASLRALPANQLDEALDGLARVLTKGIDPQSMRAALNNQQLYTAQYKQSHLLRDLDELAEVPGLGSAVRALKQGSDNAAQAPQALGRRFEIQAAAQLRRDGANVSQVTQRISNSAGNTDIDIVITEGLQRVFYQLKSTAGSFRSLPNDQAWVKKALTELDTVDYSQIKYVIPSGVNVPPIINKWLDDVGVIVIDDLPIPFP